MNVDLTHRAEMEAKGWVLVATKEGRDGRERGDFVPGDTTCLAPMRRAQVCLLDKDHRGGHSAYVMSCEECDQTRRFSQGRFFSDGFDGSIWVCWLCQKRRPW